MSNLYMPKLVLTCAWFLLILAFISLGLGLSATALEAAFGALVVFIAYSFIERN